MKSGEQPPKSDVPSGEPPAASPRASDGERRQEAASDQPARARISIAAFGALELRVGTIRSAEPHPNADRLLVLRVDLGSEERQVVAGIRAHYDAPALIGRQVVVVANLEPARLRGVESQGMVLAATDAERNRVVLLHPDEAVPPGAVVR
jgi:methionine--tRNA ligase beta chain